MDKEFHNSKKKTYIEVKQEEMPYNPRKSVEYSISCISWGGINVNFHLAKPKSTVLMNIYQRYIKYRYQVHIKNLTEL